MSRLSRYFAGLVVAVAGLGSIVATAAPGPAADVPPPDKRRVAVGLAEQLARLPAPPPIPADLASPFSPAGFDKPEGSETADGRPNAAPGAGGANATATPPTDSELLAAVAAKIPTTGTIILGGKPLLISGMNRIEAGSHFTVVYGGQEYELELVAIDRTTFTVRYKGQEFTRPIKLAKSP